MKVEGKLVMELVKGEEGKETLVGESKSVMVVDCKLVQVVEVDYKSVEVIRTLVVEGSHMTEEGLKGEVKLAEVMKVDNEQGEVMTAGNKLVAVDNLG